MNSILKPVSRRGFTGWLATAAASLTCICGKASAQNTMPSADQPGAVPGAEKSTKSEMLGLGADLLQGKSPIHAINMYLNGFHFYADDMGRQVEAHHFCTHINEEFFQCVIYDGDKMESRLIGVEYIVSARIFESLPTDEKALWHSHRHETTSGELVMPGIPSAVEHAAIASLVSTYGKTWHTWQIDRDTSLPLGIPQLMMGFTADGQLKAEMIRKRDKELDISTMEVKRRRTDLAASAPKTLTGADAWQNGKSRQLTLHQVPLKNRS